MTVRQSTLADQEGSQVTVTPLTQGASGAVCHEEISSLCEHHRGHCAQPVTVLSPAGRCRTVVSVCVSKRKLQEEHGVRRWWPGQELCGGGSVLDVALGQ